MEPHEIFWEVEEETGSDGKTGGILVAPNNPWVI